MDICGMTKKTGFIVIKNIISVGTIWQILKFTFCLLQSISKYLFEALIFFVVLRLENDSLPCKKTLVFRILWPQDNKVVFCLAGKFFVSTCGMYSSPSAIGIFNEVRSTLMTSNCRALHFVQKFAE